MPCCIEPVIYFVVVTGSSEGIGKAYAIELAKKGMNIVLISKDVQALQLTAIEISRYNSSHCHNLHASKETGTKSLPSSSEWGLGWIWLLMNV